jgi:hypothetical protein
MNYLLPGPFLKAVTLEGYDAIKGDRKRIVLVSAKKIIKKKDKYLMRQQCR